MVTPPDLRGGHTLAPKKRYAAARIAFWPWSKSVRLSPDCPPSALVAACPPSEPAVVTRPNTSTMRSPKQTTAAFVRRFARRRSVC
jgi:hypothetical protein